MSSNKIKTPALSGETLAPTIGAPDGLRVVENWVSAHDAAVAGLAHLDGLRFLVRINRNNGSIDAVSLQASYPVRDTIASPQIKANDAPGFTVVPVDKRPNGEGGDRSKVRLFQNMVLRFESADLLVQCFDFWCHDLRRPVTAEQANSASEPDQCKIVCINGETGQRYRAEIRDRHQKFAHGLSPCKQGDGPKGNADAGDNVERQAQLRAPKYMTSCEAHHASDCVKQTPANTSPKKNGHDLRPCLVGGVFLPNASDRTGQALADYEGLCLVTSAGGRGASFGKKVLVQRIDATECRVVLAVLDSQNRVVWNAGVISHFSEVASPALQLCDNRVKIVLFAHKQDFKAYLP